NCLIGAFAAKSQIELLAEDSFTRFRKAVGESSQINIGTANHGNSRTFGHGNSILKTHFHVRNENQRTPSLFSGPDCVNELSRESGAASTRIHAPRNRQ